MNSMPGQPVFRQFALHSLELDQVIENGRVVEGGQEWIALPRGLTSHAGGADALEFELVDPAALVRPSAVALWMQTVRAVSLTATFTPCLAVLLFGLGRGWGAHWAWVICSWVGVVALQIAVNLLNDIEDYRKLIDLPGSLGGGGAIQQGWLSVRQIRHVAYAGLTIGMILGIPALTVSPQVMLAVGLIAGIGTIGYSGRPFGFKYKALGDVAVLALCGPGLTVGFATAAFGESFAEVWKDPGIWAIGWMLGLAACSILHTNNLQDMTLDRSRGATTVATLLGDRGGRVLLALFYLSSFASWVLYALNSSGLSWTAMVVPLLSALPVAAFVWSILVAADLGQAAHQLIRVRAAQLHLVMGLSLSSGLALAHQVKI
jgi:1,4-dihydroxy-2-naphthoate polyprenyltransferase